MNSNSKYFRDSDHLEKYSFDFMAIKTIKSKGRNISFVHTLKNHYLSINFKFKDPLGVYIGLM